MGLDNQIKMHAAGARYCTICKVGLPAHESWPGAPSPLCGQERCRTRLMARDNRGSYIGPNQIRCVGPDCQNFIPEGRYNKAREFFYCSGECWKTGKLKGTRRRQCACGCGEWFLGPYSDRSRRYVSKDHIRAHQWETYLQSAGAFRSLAIEYLEGYAKMHYANETTPRKALGPLFIFLNQEGVTSIEDVSTQVISDFLKWAEKTGRRSVKNTIAIVSTFFKWTIGIGHRKGGNPVIPLIHATRPAASAPRPFESEELDVIWRLLEERGNAKLRLAAAIAEEAGLRISEICRLKLGNIDVVRRRIHVGLPNKGKKERWPYFSSKTVKYYAEWMAERDPNCGHDSLFYNLQKKPSQAPSLRTEFKKVMLKTFRGKQINEEGFDRWWTHRFRHTMASNLATAGADVNVIMTQGGVEQR
jgi:integrase/recombinase XerC